MRRGWQSRREPAVHADDWLMTYADVITLLLCFFAVFLSVSVAKRSVPPAIEIARPVLLPIEPPDFLEGNLPLHGVERADHATLAASPEPAPAAVAARPAETPPPAAAPAPVEAPPAPAPVAAPAPAPPEISAVAQAHGHTGHEQKGDRITSLEMDSAAFFDSGSASLRAPGPAILSELAQKLKAPDYRDYRITVEGHTDDSPINTARFPSNWELSTARAAAVLHFLLDQGIPAAKLRAAGYADTFPKVPNRDADGNAIPENQAQNRRVVITLEKIDKAS